MARTRAVPRVFQPPSSSSFPPANVSFRQGDLSNQSALERLPQVVWKLVCSYVSLQTKVLGMFSLSHHCYHSINDECFDNDRHVFRQLPPISILPRLRRVAAIIVDGNSTDVTPLFTTCFNDQQISLQSLVFFRQAEQCITLFQQLASARWYHLHTLIINDLRATDFATLPNFPCLHTFELHGYASNVTNIDQFLDRHPTITSLTLDPPPSAQIWKSTTMLPQLQVLGLGNHRNIALAVRMAVRVLLGAKVMSTQAVRPIFTITSQIRIPTSDTSLIYELLSSSTLRNINIRCSIADWNMASSINSSSCTKSESEIQSLLLQLETDITTAAEIETCFQSIASRFTALRYLALAVKRVSGVQQSTLTPFHSLRQLRILSLVGQGDYRSSDMTAQFLSYSDPSHWLHLRTLTLWLTMENTPNRTNVTRFFSVLSPKLTDLIIHSDLEPYSAMDILSVVGGVCHNVERLVYLTTFYDVPPHGYKVEQLLKCASFSTNTIESFRALVSLIVVDNHWAIDANGFQAFMSIFRSPLRYLALPSAFNLSAVSVCHLAQYSSLLSIAGGKSTAVDDMLLESFSESSVQRNFEDSHRGYTEPITPTQLPADKDEVMRRMLIDQSLTTWHRQQQWITDLTQNRQRPSRTVRTFCSNESRNAFFQSLSIP